MSSWFGLIPFRRIVRLAAPCIGLVAASTTLASPALALDVGAEVDVGDMAGGRAPLLYLAGSDGQTFVLVWDQREPGVEALRAARLRASDGALLDKQGFEVLAKPLLLGAPSVACAPGKNECLVAIVGVDSTHALTTGYTSTLMHVLIDTTNGQTKSATLSVYPAIAGMAPLVSTAALSNEYLVLRGTAPQTNTTEAIRVASVTGYGLGSTVTLLTQVAAASCTGDGTNFLVGWGNNTAAYVARVSPTDLSFVDAPQALDASGVGPLVASAGGSSAAAWLDARKAHFARVSSSDGSILDSPSTVVGPVATSLQFAADGTSYVVATNSGAWRLDPATGSSTSLALPILFTGENLSVVGGGGKFLLAARPFGDPLLRRYDDAGSLLDSADLEVPRPTESAGAPSIACGTHECLVAWRSYDRYGTLYSHAVRVSPVGAVLDTVPLTWHDAINAYAVTQRPIAFDGSNYLLSRFDVGGFSAVRASDGAEIAGYSGGGLANAPLAASTSGVAALSTPSGWDVVSTATMSAVAHVAGPTGWRGDGIITNGSGFLAFTASQSVSAVRFSEAGLIDAAPVTLVGSVDDAAVAFDGTQYIVLYTAPNLQLRVARFDTNLAPLEVPGPLLADRAYRPTMSFDGASTLVGWLDSIDDNAPNRFLMRRLRTFGGLVPLDFGPEVVEADARANGSRTWQIGALSGGPFVVAGNRYVAETPYVSDRPRVRWIAARTLGASCGSFSQCDTGFCVDGVCCDSSCGDGNPNDCLVCGAGPGGATAGRCRPVTSLSCHPDGGASGGVADGGLTSATDAGAPGAHGDAASGVSDGAVVQPSDAGLEGAQADEGCSCRVGMQSSHTPPNWLATIGVAAVIRRRRRRARL